MNLSKALLVSQLFVVTLSKSLRGVYRNERELRTRIIGGKEATEGRYSYAVSLQDDVGHFCGGSLIAPDVVLSAAHCAGGDYKAIIGRHHLKKFEGDEMDVKVEMTHPDYDSDTTDNDFMLLFLDSSYTGYVNLVQVSPDTVSEGTNATVMGWGDTHKDEEINELATELMEVDVTVMSNDDCERSESNERGFEYNYNDQITGNMMCAENLAEKDSCQGDSGGPLVIRSGSRDIQVGVVSWGKGCAHDDFPGVYARVSAQYEWIRTNICEGSSSPPASFECDGISTTLKSKDHMEGATQDTSNDGDWATIIDENFTYGFGLFNHHGNDATHYTSTMNRMGVVRIADGESGSSALQSNKISLENNPFSRFKIVFSFYAVMMEHSDQLCLDYVLDDGSVTGEKCWSSLHAFENSEWYDGMSFEFAASSAKSLRIRFRVKGDDTDDDVLIDSVAVQGLA
mmetsp:Transcript_2809/g.4360  ORF Transcript_2809/g.4360 Transcript_2809/m.4360 type:complete len:455 (+) Transcript_2809:52-1416(+)|eukprot:CAMPEP_0196145786 /NCGR_PEP_ID=MMETSP0910-20130528/21302_1 /TAXON_ID=49265 /ORGANISM="Thalassiosira rotula, Strain GSO102" /LENGTH=454 /DNA_ID=CAMNT_0041407823 /DNA_START=130 /DNA_END=1494 /DNA_ORIENTATION=-